MTKIATLSSADIEELDRFYRELLQRAITKEGYSLEEIREIAKEIKEIYPNK